MNETNDMLYELAHRYFSNEFSPSRLQQVEETGSCPDLWASLEATGLTRIFLSEAAGGAAASWSEALPALLAASKHLMPLPFTETAVAGWVLARLGLEMPEGPLSLALPVGDHAIEHDPHGARFSGAVDAPWGRLLSHVLVPVVQGGEHVWLLLPSAGAEVQKNSNIAGQPRDRMSFRSTPAIAVGRGHVCGAQEDPKLLGALQQSIQMAGVLERVLDQSVQYANERMQFGKPIGKFQAIQQQLAVLANQVIGARMAVTSACAVLPGPNWQWYASVAKVICGQAASTAAGIAHQVHGAMGYAYEYSLHFSTRRLWAWRAEYGSDGEWAARIGRQVIERGGDRLWHDITSHDPSPMVSAGEAANTNERC